MEVFHVRIQVHHTNEARVAYFALVQVGHRFVMRVLAMQFQAAIGVESNVAVVTFEQCLLFDVVVFHVIYQVATVDGDGNLFG